MVEKNEFRKPAQNDIASNVLNLINSYGRGGCGNMDEKLSEEMKKVRKETSSAGAKCWQSRRIKKELLTTTRGTALPLKLVFIGIT